MRRADGFIAETLHIGELEPVYWIKKLLRANTEPIAVFESYWVYDIGESLSRFDLSHRSTFDIVENTLGIQLGEAEAVIEAGTADSNEASLLSVREGSPVLIMKRTVHTIDGRPIDYGKFVYRADRYKYRARMIRYPYRYLR